MELTLKAGATSQSIPVSIQDSSSTTGAGLSGLAFNTAGLTAYYLRAGGSPTAITLATLAAINSAYSSGGFKEADATNMKGVYRLDLPDAAMAAGAAWVAIYLYGATNMVPVRALIFLTAVDHQSATAFVSSVPAVVGAVGSVTGNVGGNVTGSVGSVATGGIAAASFAAGAIDAAAIAADAIGSSELAASAVTEIQSGLSTLDAAGVRTAVGLASANLDAQLAAIAGYIDTEVAAILAAVDTEVAAIKTKTDQLTFTTANQVDANALSLADGVITAAKIAADAITAAKIAADAITSAKIATDAIDADSLAADAVTEIFTKIFTTALTESYRSAGSPGTLAQYVHEIIAHLGEMSISGTTKTLKKLDGSTTAKTYTLNDATTPTAITETT